MQKILLILFFSMLSSAWVVAQTKQVSGKVTSQDDGSVLPGVSVSVKGSTTGTVTDGNGAYSFTVPGDDVILVFSFIGYLSQEVALGARSTVNVQMQNDVKALDEVVVTGYTTENRRDVTGAVSTVKARELVAVPSGNVEQALQGRVSGVTVITNGQPGTTSVVRLRGFGSFNGNEPLYVVDGVPVTSTEFLQPNDIETTTVLKDAASASIYGARAANGVIVYTTKHGKKGAQKLNVNYDGVFGVTTPGKVDNILNPQESANYTWAAIRNAAIQTGSTPTFDHHQYGKGPEPVIPDYLLVGPNNGVIGSVDLEAERVNYNVDFSNGRPIYQVIKANKAGTNWWNAITRPGLLSRHLLSFSGGTDKSHFYVSLGAQDQQGILLNQSFKRYSVRINSEYNVAKRLRIGENFQTSYVSVKGLLGDNGGRGASGNENYILDAFRMHPLIPLKDEFGGYAGTAAKGFNNPDQPVANLNRTKDNNAFALQGFGNLYAELDLFKGFMLRSSIGGGYNSFFINQYEPRQYENSENNSSYTYRENRGHAFNWIFTNTASYQKAFGMHSINVLAGIEALNTGISRNLQAYGLNPFFTDPNYVTLSTTSGTGRTVNGDYNGGVNFFSTFGRVAYTFNDKYTINGIVRRDGSSRFSSTNRFGTFPAVSVSWRISDEGFMQDLPFIDELKLRAGYGKMGNSNNVDPNNQFSLFGSSIGIGSYDIGGTNSSVSEGFYRNRIGNPNAKWETSVTSNIGLDGTLFGGKLEFVLDFWKKLNTDLLYALETPGVTGVLANDPAINIAEMKNQGIDLELLNRGNIIPDLTYEVKLTGSFLDNEITALAPGVPYFDSFTGSRIGALVRNQIGQPISSFFGYKVTGLFQNQAEVDAAPAQDGKGVGRFRYADVNNDGVINADDRTALGSPVPKFSGGINLKVNYKNFELETFLNAFLGGKIYNFSRWYTDFYPSFPGAAIGERVRESFTFERGGNTTPIFENISNLSTNGASNSYYVESGSYARLTNLQLGYNLPSGLLNRAGIVKAKVYLQATNLLTFSKYSGLDPGVGGAADTNLGIDVGNPPVTRGFNIGVSLGL
jgi:TonB-linked SusC/RagA family outer membrane protein